MSSGPEHRLPSTSPRVPPPGLSAAQVAAHLDRVYVDAEHQPVIRSRVAAALARAWAGTDDTLGSTYADEAARIGEEIDDSTLLAEALDSRLATCAGPDDLVARLETSMWLAEVAAGVSDPAVRLRAHLWRLTTSLEQLDLPTIRRQLAALDLLADETRDDRIRFYAAARRAMFALTEGDVVGAARLAAEATEAGVSARLPETETVQRALHAEMARQRDDRAALTRVAESFEEIASTGATALLAEAAVLWLEGGRPVRAARIVDRLAPALTDLPRTADWLLVVAKTCEAAAGSGRPGAAAACVDLLAPYAGRAVLTSGAIAFAGVVEDYLALATGEVARAEQARAAYARIGADWWSGRGSLGRATDLAADTSGPRVFHLHPDDGDGPTSMWCVGRDDALRKVASMPGLQHVRLLLEKPGVDVPVVELAAAVDGVPAAAEPGVLVDQQALTTYRRRVRELDEAIERAEAGTDAALTARLRSDRDTVITEARSGGMTAAQRGGTPSERTRVAVRQAIMAALARLELHDSEVAQALRTTIHTGSSCRYEPDPLRPVEWRISSDHHASRPLVDP